MSRGVPDIRGAGGKGSGGGFEMPDSIRSTQTADVLDLLSEGEVQGLTNGLRSIYLDGVPLQNADGSFNFEGVQVQVTAGTQGQPAIAGADGVSNEVPVSVIVTQATPVVRSISNAAVDTVRVTIEVPRLTRQDTGNGDLYGSAFEWAIDLQSNGGGFVQVLTDRVDGKTLSRYTRSKEFALSGPPPWDIRVRRITPDATSAVEVNEFRWSSYTEVQSLKLRYPNSAMARVRVGAQQFSRIPTRAYDLMGLRVRVPTNYDPMTKVYTGIWDGTFKVDWTDCPAWHFYDLVTSSRYGLGRWFQPGPGLKWEMYAIGRYCDEMVPDGNGGMEPRFRAGLYLTTREQAYKVVQDLAAIFRGMAYWGGSDMAVTQDAPGDPAALFTNANVVDGRFVYTSASHSKRHSQVVVWRNSLEEFGRLVPEVVVDRALQLRYGVRSLELSPLGVWSRGQAQRLGKWVLYSEQREGATVSFRVGLDGALVAPGKVFQVADAKEAGERLGGRVRSATAGSVTLDHPVTLAAGESYTLSVMLPAAGDPARLVPQTRAVTTAAGAGVQTLAVSPAFSQAPAAGTVWVLQSAAVQVTSWRCLAVNELEGGTQFEVMGLRHEPQKYDLIEQGISFETASVSRIPRVPPRPASLACTETVYQLGLERRIRASVSWPEPAQGLQYLVSWRLGGGPWNELPATGANCVDIDALPPGDLEVAVKSRNALGTVSPARSATFTLLGNQVAVGANLVDPSWWRPGAAWEWDREQDVGTESEIVWGVGPRGALQALWQATQAGTPAVGPDGGWRATDPDNGLWPKNLARVDPAKTYRFAVPVMRLSGSGPIYFGPNSAGSAAQERVCTLNTSTALVNPYFFSSALPLANRWYLIEAFVFPAGSTGISGTVGGLFDMETGERVAAVTNFCWKAGARNVRTRAFQYYASAGAVARFAPPTVELVDGTQGAWAAGPPGRDGASAFTWQVSGGCVGAGPTLEKASGTNGWNAQGYSTESYVGGAYATGRSGNTTAAMMLGLNGDPATDASYTSIDYAWYWTAGGQLEIYESGTLVANSSACGDYTTATTLAVVYDGQTVRYLKDGVVMRSVGTTANRKFHLDSSINQVGGRMVNVGFGPAGARGADGVNGLNNALVHIYRRASSTPALPSAAVTYTFATGAISGLNNGWSATPPSGSDPLYVSVATASAAGATDTIAAGEWASPVVMALDGTPGANGINTATVYLFRRTDSATPPALPSAAVTYTFATGAAAGVNNGWSQNMPAAGGAYRWMTTATALGTGSSDTIASGEWAAASLLAQDGTDGANGLNNALVHIYRRASSTPALPSGTATYTFATGGITGLNNGWSATPPAGSDPLYVSVATASSTTGTDTIGPGEWASPVVMAQDGQTGAAGINAATVFLYQRNDTGTPPALPGSSLTYTFATGVLSGTLGSWTQTVPASGGRYLYVTTATALGTGSTDTIAAGEWATVRVLAQDGAPGADGQNVARVRIYQRAASAPAVPSATVTYTFATGAISGLNNGWSATIPAGSNPLYVTEASAAAAGATDTIASGEWASPVVMAQNGAPGADGINAATVFLYQRNDTGTPPSVPGSSTTYTFATGVLSGTLGSWTQTVPADSSGRYLYVTTATALGTGATDSIASGEWAAVRLMSQDATKQVRVYRRAATAPSTPTGNGTPASWSATPPAADGTPLWMSESTQRMDGTLIGSWSAPVKADATPDPGPVTSPGTFYAYGFAISTYDASAYVEFRRNGEVFFGQGSSAAAITPAKCGNWYLPNGTAVGDDYQIRFDPVSGSHAPDFGSALGTWHTLNAPRSAYLYNDFDGYSFRNAVVSYSIRRTSDGVVLSTGLLHLNADVEI